MLQLKHIARQAISLHKSNTQTYLLKVLKRQQYTIFFLFNSIPRSFFVMTNWRFTYQLVAAKCKQEKITEYLPKDNDVIRGPTENKNRHNYNCHLECFCSCPIQHSGTWTSKPHIWIDKIEIWWQFWYKCCLDRIRLWFENITYLTRILLISCRLWLVLRHKLSQWQGEVENMSSPSQKQYRPAPMHFLFALSRLSHIECTTYVQGVEQGERHIPKM